MYDEDEAEETQSDSTGHSMKRAASWLFILSIFILSLNAALH